MVKHRVRKPSKRAVEAGREVVRRKAFAHLPPVEFEGEEYPDYIGMADGYVDAVISGLVIENQFVIKAAKRYRKMRKAAEKRDNPYFWSPAHAVEVCAFAERWPMSTGGRLVIEPCQAWWLVAIFGFREISEGGRNVRWVREAHLEMARKNGKALDLDTPIPTPTGWATMRDLRVGDEVIAIDGSATRISATSEVMTGRDCFEVSFSNGEKIVADADHLWVTTARNLAPGSAHRANSGLKYGHGQPTAARTTRQIFETLKYGARGDRNHSLQMPQAADLAAVELPIDPYVLGYWLGDGTSQCTALTVGRGDLDHVLKELKRAGYWTRITRTNSAFRVAFGRCDETGQPLSRNSRQNLARIMRSLGALPTKRIPPAYLRGAKQDRLALLQGLMDSDGTIGGRSQCEFVSKSDGLADDMCELLASLGIKFSRRLKTPVCNGKRLNSYVNTIAFSGYAGDREPFRMARKKRRLTAATSASRGNTLTIIDVQPVASRPVKCIAIEHPSRQFLCGRTMVPTHNSEIGAIVDIYCFLFEGEEGSQVLLGASSKAQARKVFDPIYKGLQREEDLRMMFALKVTAKEIRQPQTGGYITTVSSIGRKEDGHNPHVGHIDEVHAISDAFYEVMRSSFGARDSQLFLKTTTAGHYFHGPGYAQRQRIERVLNEQESADRLFAVIYTIDPEDLKTPFKWSNIIKANPMLGVIKRDSAYIDDIEGARHNPFTRGEFIVKTLNFYAQTNERAIQSADWDKCKEEGLSLLDYVGQRCFGGIDLASRDDMTAIALIFEHKTVPGAVAVFVEHYCPAEAPGFYDDRVSALYEQWKEQGFLKTTPGGILDFDVIEKRIIELDLIFNGEAWVFDEAQHTQMISKLQKKNVEAGAIRATAVNLAEPTKDMLALIRDGKFRHDGNPILRWNALNVRIQGSELPRPAKDKAAAHMKIDGISAASHANTARLSRLTIKKPKEDKPPPNYDRIVRTL